VVLQVQDFGHGMPTTLDSSGHDQSAGVGILGMRERLHHIGGWLDVQSDASGTTLTVTVPLALASVTSLQP
jgi:signal transduction histidine kinase